MDFEKNLKAGRKLAQKIANRRNVLVTFQVDEDVRRQAAEKAKECGINMSEFLRRCMERFLDMPLDSMMKDAVRSAADSSNASGSRKKGVKPAASASGDEE